ncbi:MAG: MBL fold metallo-hydrolase [Clostridia bacterium]|nr:MBL fold metallo-hydrolase [Clostridia bacterium]
MIKIHFLGTCSGTEPMKNMHHTSTLLDIGGSLYWFDAGECCVHTAVTSGIDIMKSEAIFVTHPHIDHIGGLANLFFAFDKMIGMHKKSLPNGNTLEVFFPEHNTFEAIKTVALSGSISLRDFRFTLNEHGISDGVIFDDGKVRVKAKSNHHLKDDGADGVFHAFSYLVEAEGKRILLSGDVKSPSELDYLISDGVDLLVMETGHHKVSDVCEYAVSHNVKALRLNHHGREILGNRVAAEELTASYAERYGISIKLAYDGMTEEY